MSPTLHPYPRIERVMSALPEHRAAEVILELCRFSNTARLTLERLFPGVDKVVMESVSGELAALLAATALDVAELHKGGEVVN